LPDKPAAAQLAPLVQDWTTFPDPDGRDLHVAIATYQGVHYWLVKDSNDTVLVYDKQEWGCFIQSAREGEFDQNKADM
jgi:hypothetical protein